MKHPVGVKVLSLKATNIKAYGGMSKANGTLGTLAKIDATLKGSNNPRSCSPSASGLHCYPS